MAPRYAFTFQLGDRDFLGRRSPGHAATVISTPQQQTYSGLGPASHDWRSFFGTWSSPSFVPQVVQREEAPPRSRDPYNYSTVSGHDPYATFTVPITKDQAEKALAEIRRKKDARESYNIFKLDHCTSDVSGDMRAAGLGTSLPYQFPWSNQTYLSDVERTLRSNPRAKYIVDGAGRPAPIPDAIRQIQRDYAFVGGGYDSPSERSGHVPSSSGPPNPHMWRSGTSPIEFVEQDESKKSSTAKAVRVLSRRATDQLRAPDFRGPENADRPDSFDERFGSWTASPGGSSPRNPNLPLPLESGRPVGLVSGAPMPHWTTPPPIVDDLEISAAPASELRGETIEDWLARLLRRYSPR